MLLRAPKRLLLTVTLVAALTACGSTVQTEGTTAGGTLGQPVAGVPGTTLPDGTVVPGTTDQGTLPDGSLPGGTSPGGSLPGGTTPGGTSPGGTTPGDPGTPGDAGNGGGGGGTQDPLASVSDKVVQVGISYTGNGGAANAAIGASGLTTGDSKANMLALINDINARGGVGGRTIKPVFFEYDAQSSATPASQDQAACSAYTEDNKVAIVLGGSLTESLDSCLQNAGVLQIASGTIIRPDRAYLDKYASRIQLGTMTQERMMTDLVPTLKRLDYFSPWDFRTGRAAATGKPVIGVLTVDLPEFTRPLRSTLLPKLKAAGYAVDDKNIYAVRSAQTTGELTGTVSDVQNATLRFASSGVTHVVILDGSATVALLFAQSASRQLYYPRWGINSGTGAQALRDQGLASPQNLNGAVGLGWLPNIDIQASAAAAYRTSASSSCLALLRKKTGQAYDSSNAEGIAYSDCDAARLMELALQGAGRQLSLRSVVGSIEAIGSKFKPALIPSSFLGRGRHDNVQTGFDMKFDGGCSCVKYAGQHAIG